MGTIFVALFILSTTFFSVAFAQLSPICSEEITRQNSSNFFQPAVIFSDNLSAYSGIAISIRYAGQPKSQLVDPQSQYGQGFSFQWNWENDQVDYEYLIEASVTTGTFGLQNPKVFRTGWVKSNKKAVCLRTALWKGPQAKSTSVTLPAFREQNRELILLRIEDANCAGTVAGKSVFFKKGQNIEDQTLNYFTCSGLEPAKLSLKYTYYENGILKRGEVSSQEFTPSFAITSDILKP